MSKSSQSRMEWNFAIVICCQVIGFTFIQKQSKEESICIFQEKITIVVPCEGQLFDSP